MKATLSHSERALILTGLAPFASGVLFVILGAAPAALPELHSITPLFGLCVIFFWVLVRPSLMPPAAVFSIGIMHDALSGGPIGLWALTFLLVQHLILPQRRVLLGNAFAHGWIGFALLALTAASFAWLVACVYYGALLSPSPVLAQALLTIFVYPAVAWTLIRFWRLMPATL